MNKQERQNFENAMQSAKKAEKLVMNLLQDYLDYKKLDNQIFLKYVGDDKEYYKKGDIQITNTIEDTIKYGDVKHDRVIHKTSNVYCEEKTYRIRQDFYEKGFMQNGDYDYMYVLCSEKCELYIVDFKKLKEVYKKDYTKEIYALNNYKENSLMYGYCVPIKTLEEKEILTTIKYDESYNSLI